MQAAGRLRSSHPFPALWPKSMVVLASAMSLCWVRLSSLIVDAGRRGLTPWVVCRVKVNPRHTPPAHVSLSTTSALYRCNPEGIINRTDVRCIYWTWTANIGKPEGPGADLGMCSSPTPCPSIGPHSPENKAQGAVVPQSRLNFRCK